MLFPTKIYHTLYEKAETQLYENKSISHFEMLLYIAFSYIHTWSILLIIWSYDFFYLVLFCSLKGIIKLWNMPSYLYCSIEVRSRRIIFYLHVAFFSFRFEKLTRIHNGEVRNSLKTTVLVMYIQLLKT